MYVDEEKLRRIIREELERVLRPADEQTVGIDEIAAYLGVTKATAAVKASNGDIPGFKVGRSWRFYLSEVKAHLSRPVDPWQQSNQSRARHYAWEQKWAREGKDKHGNPRA